MADYKVVETDVLIIGGGGAGVRAALAANEEGVRVAMVLKGQVAHSGITPMAGPSYQAVLSQEQGEDSLQIAFEDTVREGRFLGDENLVQALVTDAPVHVPTLQQHGLKLAREEGGDLRQVQHPGQSFPRNLVMMGCGYGMMVALKRELLQHAEIRTYEDHFATALLQDDGRVCGAVTLDQRRGGITVFRARAVVLATGGYEQLWDWNDTEPGATGDGAALAFHAGAPLVDMEMVQFYPTCLVRPEEVAGATIGYEGLLNPRSIGGTLRNALGQQLLPSAQYPGEPPPRDVLMRLMFKEMQGGRATSRGGLLIDLTAVPRPPEETFALLRQSGLVPFNNLRDLGVDVTREPVEVRPALHHCLGGVRINERTETDVAGLYAAGEAAGNLHGANRISGNAITETQVFGARAGMYAARYARGGSHAPLDGDRVEAQVRHLSSLVEGHQRPLRPTEVKAKVKAVMQQYMAHERHRQGMALALDTIRRIRREDLPRVRAENLPRFNYPLQEAVESANLVDLAEVTILAALERKESRGHHYRADHPEPSVRWLKHTIAIKGTGGVTITTAPVIRIGKPARTSP